MVWCGAVLCGVVWCVALQCVAVRCGAILCGVARGRGVGVVRCGVVLCAWGGVGWGWCGVVCWGSYDVGRCLVGWRRQGRVA